MWKHLVVAGLFTSVPALADTPSLAQAGAQLGKCIVKADRGSAISMLQSLPLVGAQVNWSSVALGAAAGCRNDATPPVTVTALRGGIAQELFRRDFGAFGVQPQRPVPDLARFDLPVEKNTMGTEDPTKTLFLTADCVARSNTIGTEKLIKAEPGSDQEMKIFATLAPWLSLCQGKSNMVYGRSELRSAIVQAAYNVSRRYWAGETKDARYPFGP